jgi:hypothetical protein
VARRAVALRDARLPFGWRFAMSESNEPRPSTKFDGKTLMFLLAFGGGLILLVLLNMK